MLKTIRVANQAFQEQLAKRPGVLLFLRGVGFSRPWGAKPSEWADPKTKVPRQHMPTWGDFDFDTYLREDLPCAAGYIAAVTGSKRIAAVGHSMGGKVAIQFAAEYPERIAALIVEDIFCPFLYLFGYHDKIVVFYFC